jgi:hypothetical protein
VGKPRLKLLEDVENHLRKHKQKRRRQTQNRRQEWVFVVNEAKLLEDRRLVE